MDNFKNISVSVIGSGNVAYSLIPAVINGGYTIDYVVGRNVEALQLISKLNKIPYTTDLNILTSDVIILAISDDAIAPIAQKLKTSPEQLILHTAGSVSLDVLKQYHNYCGVLYPLQTFSKKRIVDYKTVPLCIEGTTDKALETIKQLALSLSENIYKISSSERLSVHTAAVFVSNFTNIMYTMGAKILEENGIDFNILKPLILETAQKVITLHPTEAQTGPALRRDTKTMKLHLNQLDSKTQSLYSLLSNLIQDQFPRNQS